MLASIIIATYNEEKYIQECVDSLENQSMGKGDYEILIIDGGSTDKTNFILNELKNKYENLRLFFNPQKIQAAAFNIGIREACSDYVFIVGAHAKFDKDFIKNSVNAMQNDNIACVGGKVIFKAKTYIGKHFAAVRSTLLGGGTSAYRYSNKKQYCETVSFGCYKKSELISVGGYNEKLVKNQDNDVNKRLRANGGKLLFDPSIIFYYYTRDSLKTIIKQMYNYGYWEAKVIKEDKTQFSIATCIPTIFILYLIASILIGLITGNIIPFLLQFIPYAILTLFFSIKYIKPQKLNIFVAVILYFLLHVSVGSGFINGVIKKY